MLDLVNGILTALQLPPANLQLDLPISLSGATVKYDETKGLVCMLDTESSPQWKFLREHLGKRDPLWAGLQEWRKAMTAHIRARRQLIFKARILIEEKTGYKLVDKPTQPPLVWRHTTVHLLYQEALSKALGQRESSDLEERIITDVQKGEVRHGPGTVLAAAPGKEEECRRGILAALKNLRASAEVQQVASTIKPAKDAIAKARRLAEEISLLGLVPGQCRLCQRLEI